LVVAIINANENASNERYVCKMKWMKFMLYNYFVNVNLRGLHTNLKVIKLISSNNVVGSGCLCLCFLTNVGKLQNNYACSKNAVLSLFLHCFFFKLLSVSRKCINGFIKMFSLNNLFNFESKYLCRLTPKQMIL
jgi:hypothetical protein